jgi:hypothetical protein
MVSIPFADELVIRAWTGGYDPVDHEILYTEMGDGHLVALHVLRERLSALTCGPAEARVDGDYSENYSRTLTILENQIARLEQVVENLGLTATSSREQLTAHRVTRGGMRVR